MKPPRFHAHPCNPQATVYGAELEPGDVLQSGDVFAGCGPNPSEEDRRISAKRWLPLIGWVAKHVVGTPVHEKPFTVWIRPRTQPSDPEAWSEDHRTWVNEARP